MPEVEIIPLSERPEMADICAAWNFSEWGCQDTGCTLQSVVERYSQKAQNKSNDLPVTWIAMCEGRIVGTVGLKDYAHPDREEASPGVSTLYVHRVWRGKGVGRLLMEKAEDEARARGYKALWLYTSDSVSFYEKLGWQQVDTVKEESFPGRMVPLMRKNL